MKQNNNQLKLDELRERLALYRKAEKKILQGQSYTLGSRQLTRASLSSVQKMIDQLENKIDALEQRGTTKRRLLRGVPVD